ncbi:MAG: energy transducer TonB [Bacteroidetes bacterium]|nr:energy transducer TonB [Bacteroidota bacterium]
MDRPFLIGRFLPAHGASFGRLPKRALTKGAISTETLAKRFEARAISFHHKNLEYLVFGQIGMILSLSLTIGAFTSSIGLSGMDSIEAPEQELVQMEEMVQTAQIQRPPPPPRPPVPVEVPDETRLDDSELDLDAFLDINVAITDLPPPAPAPSRKMEEEEDEIFVVVEQMPVIKGGLQQLYKYVQYPDLARKAGLEGTVVIKIVVSPEGKPTKPEVLKSVHKVLDDAAINGIMQLEFEPARQRNRPVSVWISIPVVFDLR